MLRATDRETEAAALERGDFSRALSVARAAADSLVDEASLLTAEADRVADACVLADVLAPLLAGRLRTTAPPPVTTAALEAASPAVSPPAPSFRPERAPAPGIADLIDGMLSQERAFSAAHSPS